MLYTILYIVDIYIKKCYIFRIGDLIAHANKFISHGLTCRPKDQDNEKKSEYISNLIKMQLFIIL